MIIKVRARAYRDLAKIWDYVADDKSAAIADALDERIFAAIRQLALEPGIGHQREDVSDDRYRFWCVDSFIIAYRVEGARLIVSRVVHGARDFRKLF